MISKERRITLMCRRDLYCLVLLHNRNHPASRATRYVRVVITDTIIEIYDVFPFILLKLYIYFID